MNILESIFHNPEYSALGDHYFGGKRETFEETKEGLKKQFPDLTEEELINKTKTLIDAIKKL